MKKETFEKAQDIRSEMDNLEDDIEILENSTEDPSIKIDDKWINQSGFMRKSMIIAAKKQLSILKKQFESIK